MPLSHSKHESTSTIAAAASSGGSSTRHRSHSSRSRGFEPRPYSSSSTSSIPESCFWTKNLLLGASMVVIQPSSGKVLVVNNTAKRSSWFLPRGRKDIGESLEQCALREAYEETGYRVEFLPLFLPLRAPAPPSRPNLWQEPTVSEPIFVTTHDFGPYRHGNWVDPGGQYIIHYYAGQIPADAVREEGTGMPDEKDYVGTLLELKEALRLLPRVEAHITETVYWHWLQTIEEEKRRRVEAMASGHRRASAGESGIDSA